MRAVASYSPPVAERQLPRSPPRCPLFPMRCPTPRTAVHCTSLGALCFLLLLSLLHTHRWRTPKRDERREFEAPSCREARGRLTARGKVTLKANDGHRGSLRAVCSIENRMLTLSIAQRPPWDESSEEPESQSRWVSPSSTTTRQAPTRRAAHPHVQ
jgi:hypothetical protein